MSRVAPERVGVVGLGYVGLPVALAMSKAFETVAFDIDEARVGQLCAGYDVSGEVTPEELAAARVTFSARVEAIEHCTFIVVAVPTPVGPNGQPDLTALTNATELVASQLRVGSVVVYESTVYPGLTEGLCGPLLEHASGLRVGHDFFLAYSPERINPGDKAHGFGQVKKVVAAQDERTLQRVSRVYSTVVAAGVHQASSIAVAEAAKIIENTQRDVNIALMNEFALVFDRLGLRTADVLSVARTKWNFLDFEPGLVGGQCVGVAPLYLSSKARAHGFRTDLILQARRTNDGMAEFVANKVIGLIENKGLTPERAKVGVLGVTFKENVADVRHSAVPRMVAALAQTGAQVLVHDPVAQPCDVQRVCGIEGSEFDALTDLDVMVLAVNHRYYHGRELTRCLVAGGLFVDVKSKVEARAVRSKGFEYWSL